MNRDKGQCQLSHIFDEFLLYSGSKVSKYGNFRGYKKQYLQFSIEFCSLVERDNCYCLKHLLQMN